MQIDCMFMRCPHFFQQMDLNGWIFNNFIQINTAAIAKMVVF